MANDNQVTQLFELAKDFNKTTVDQIISHGEWGEIDFESGRQALERTFSLLEQFRRLPIGLLPERIMEQIIASLPPLLASLEQIRNFSIDQANPIGARDQLVEQYARQADRFFKAALLYNCLSCVLEGRRLGIYACPTCILEQ